MLFGYGSMYVQLLSWFLLILTIYKLPALVRRTNLDDRIDSAMQNTIRGVLIAYFLINFLIVLSEFVVAYASGVFVWLHG